MARTVQPAELRKLITERLRALSVRTMGGQQVWVDRLLRSGWRIQEQFITGRHRLLDPGNRQRGSGSYAHCQARLDELLPQVLEGRHLVLMIGGLGGFRSIFGPMRRALNEAGYDTTLLSYPSTRQSIEEHASDVETVLNRLEGVSDLTIVAHSMGGLIMRVVLAREAPWQQHIKIHGIVMMGTPNRGARMAGLLHSNRLFRLITTEAGQNLRANNVRKLPPITCRHRLIAGSTRPGKGINPLLRGDDDGIVAVHEVFPHGSPDRLIVRSLHQYLPRHPESIEAVKRFLKERENGI
ncbi:esterase/lipase family protein [Govanella unica]|uniref:Alpha/beta hydrolase n=1 Tax=Govanella unica TaxID=2975056 RepID=A0A9X3Z7X3_9PROT|nr:alpha/beta fold hydrolase [Govania unica]MDA5194478.1 alpha/beta hydrolase [Govania unica]